METTTLLEYYKQNVVKINENSHGAGYMAYNVPNLGLYFGTFTSPTYNCQNCSIAGFGDILNIESLLFTITTKDIRELIKHVIQIELGRGILLIDVNDRYKEKVLDVFEGCEFIVNQPYVSTNGSNMVLFYIKTNNL